MLLLTFFHEAAHTLQGFWVWAGKLGLGAALAEMRAK